MNFSQQIVAWYHQHGRKQLPWQLSTGEIKPYHVWLSEIMLQQTQVIKVMEYFDRFIQALPTLDDLANADEQEVLALWSGLGYYNRAKNLHKTAQLCQLNHHSQLPKDLDVLIELPGIGRSTAAAIMSLAYNLPEPIMDGNVKRVFARYFMVAGEPNKSSTLKQLWQLADTCKEHDEPAAYTQGLMDLGAMVCTKHRPNCEVCPIHTSCQAKAKDVIAQYPMKKQKVRQQEIGLYVVLAVDKNSVALEQRQAGGIWPDLWFLPTYDSQQSLMSAYPEAHAYFSYTHKLTHRILQLHVYQSEQLNFLKTVKMIDRNDLPHKPHPKALIHILNQHDNH